MPPKPLSDKVDDLREAFNSLTRQVGQLDSELSRVVERVVALERNVDQLRLDAPLVRQEVAEIKRSRDEWGRRGWTVLLALVSAAVGGTVTYVLKR